METINVNLPELPYAVEEALNRLRINVKFCGNNTKKILIVSSLPNEGKSFVSIHLWRMLAEAGFPTLLVDTDLRKSVMKTKYQFSSEKEIKGLAFYLSGQADLSEIIYQTNIENGYMIPCTNLLENPSSLLEDPRFREMFDKLEDSYRYIIIDAPPLINVADGALVASMSDGAILVVASGSTSRKLVKQSLDQLERTNCSLLGVVLNKADNSARTYYSSYGTTGSYRYYGEYYYGNHSDKDDD